MKKILITFFQLGVTLALLAAPKICIGRFFCFEVFFTIQTGAPRWWRRFGTRSIAGF